MFTIHQTLLSKLYMDKLVTEFVGREEGDAIVAENLTKMADYDYEGMMKDQVDFEWIWDTLFFRRGLVDMTGYISDRDNKIFLPTPVVIDITTFLRDPRASSVNGNDAQRSNSARMLGREIKMTKYSMMDNPNFYKSIKWEELKFGSGQTA